MRPKLHTQTVSGRTVYNFGFDYISKDFVKVTLDGTELTYNTDYTVEGSSVVLKEAPTETKELVIYRSTATLPLVQWTDSSIMLAKDMNLAQYQIQHLAEELQENTVETTDALKQSIGTLEAINGKAEELKVLLETARQLAGGNVFTREEADTKISALKEELQEELQTKLNEFNSQLEHINELIKKVQDERAQKSFIITHPLFGEGMTESGDCTFIGINGKWIIVDFLAKSNENQRAIQQRMNDLNIRKFDLAILSHYHNDHVGNLSWLLENMKIDKLMLPDTTKTEVTGTYGMSRSQLESIKSNATSTLDLLPIPVETITAKTIDFNGASIEFYNCSDEDYNYYRSVGNNDYNNLSVGLEINYLNRTAILEGDCNYLAMERNALRNPTNVDYLKSNHHGISNVPLSYRKLNPRDLIMTTTQDVARSNLYIQNFQNTFQQMGSNIYLLGDQVEPPMITYKGDGSITYNRKLLRDGTAGHATSLEIYVDKNYTGKLKTGDEHSPFVYLADAVRFINQVKHASVTVNIKAGDYTRVEDKGSLLHPQKALTIQNVNNKVIFKRQGEGVVNLPPVIINCCKYVYFKDVEFIGVSAGDNRKIRVYESSVVLENVKADSQKDPSNNTSNIVIVGVQGLSLVKLANVNFSAGWGAINNNGGTVILEGKENHVATSHAYVLGIGDIYVYTPFVEKNNINKSGDSSAVELGSVYFRPIRLTTDMPTGLAKGTVVPVKNMDKPQEQSFIQANGKVWIDMVYSIVNPTTTTVPDYTGQIGINGEQVFIGANGKWVKISN
nr:MAG TPA: tail fiber protein [Caudoviricetes sp.]